MRKVLGEILSKKGKKVCILLNRRIEPQTMRSDEFVYCVFG